MPETRLWRPRALGALRIATALLYMQHGLQKLFMWPPSVHHPEPAPLLSLAGVAGILELFGGLAILLRMLVRPVAFALAGERAVAYWMFHFMGGLSMPDGWMPVVNGGDLAIEFCFVFLYLSVAGPGAWSLGGHRRSEQRTEMS